MLCGLLVFGPCFSILKRIETVGTGVWKVQTVGHQQFQYPQAGSRRSEQVKALDSRVLTVFQYPQADRDGRNEVLCRFQRTRLSFSILKRIETVGT